VLIVLVPLSSHTSARKPVGKHFDRKPTQQGSRHIWSPPTGNLERYDNRRNVITNHQSGPYVTPHYHAHIRRSGERLSAGKDRPALHLWSLGCCVRRRLT